MIDIARSARLFGHLMDRDGEEAPAAKKPRLGAGAEATNDDADATIVEEHIALGESNL